MADKTIGIWQAEITAWGKRKGWDRPPMCEQLGDEGLAPMGVNVDAVLAKVALTHSELSEAVEEARDGRWTLWLKDQGPDKPAKPEGFVVELADAVIRIFHLAGLLGLDLEGAVQAKMAYNEGRPWRHGGKGA